MPFKSEKQRKYMYAQRPKIAKCWTTEEQGKSTKKASEKPSGKKGKK